MGNATAGPARIMALEALVIDAGVNIRAALDEAVVERYAEAIEALPPPVAFEGPEGVILSDGFHRVAAARRAGLAELAIEVRSGDRDAALEHAATANTGHGLPLTKAERDAAAVRLRGLHPDWTYPRIGALLGVSHEAIGQAVRAARVEQAVDSTLLATESQTGRRSTPGQPLSRRHLSEIAKAPEADWPALAETASAQGWGQEETGMAARTLADPEVAEEVKAGIREGRTPPLAKDDEGEWTVSRETLGRTVREGRADDVVGPLLKATHATAVLAVAIERNGAEGLEQLPRDRAERYAGDVEAAVRTLELALAHLRTRPRIEAVRDA